MEIHSFERFRGEKILRGTGEGDTVLHEGLIGYWVALAE